MRIWRDEAADTWRYVTNTLMLAWMPDYEPSSDAVSKARAQLSEEFESSQPQGRGRRKLSPDQVTQGKVERRWRRRALMRASLPSWQTHCAATGSSSPSSRMASVSSGSTAQSSCQTTKQSAQYSSREALAASRAMRSFSCMRIPTAMSCDRRKLPCVGRTE